MVRKHLFILISLMLVSFSVGCSRECLDENCKSTENQPLPAYPSPSNSLDEGFTYPAPAPVQSQLVVTALPEPPPEAPEPKPGMASISGLIYSYTTHVIIPETLFYLTPALGDQKSSPHILSGPDPIQGDIQSLSDTNGMFFLDNVPPGAYYLIVWAPYSWSVGELLENNIPIARLIELNPDQSLALGIVYVEWP